MFSKNRSKRLDLLALLVALLALGCWTVAAAEAATEAETETEAVAEDGGDDHGESDEHGGGHGGGHGHSSRISDTYIPLQLEGFPQRPKPFLEWGPNYLGTGKLPPGRRMPGGAVWQPTLLGFGQTRLALQSFDRGTSTTELAARLDLFFNLQLTGTERFVVGFRNLDQNGRFTSYTFDPDPAPGESRGQEELNANVGTLFFEGDFGELFPNMSKKDFAATDWGFSIGRQQLFFQEGILINDTIDAVGVTRNTLLPKNTSNFRMTFLYGLNDINLYDSTPNHTLPPTDPRSGRPGNVGNPENKDAQLAAFLTSLDVRRSTLDIDLVYVDSGASDGNSIAAGISTTQRVGEVNTSFRFLGSSTLDSSTPQSTTGYVFFSEISITPHRTHDLFYSTQFVAVNDFRSAARGPATGGPLGRAGINFAAVGIGRYGAPLSNEARDVAGAALGYQKFLSGNRKQIIFELGARVGTETNVQDQYAFTTRFQWAMKKHYVLIFDGFVGYRGECPAIPGTSPLIPIAGALCDPLNEEETMAGGRAEFVVRF